MAANNITAMTHGEISKSSVEERKKDNGYGDQGSKRRWIMESLDDAREKEWDAAEVHNEKYRLLTIIEAMTTMIDDCLIENLMEDHILFDQLGRNLGELIHDYRKEVK